MSYLDQMFGLDGKVAIVTGGVQGIGQVVAVGLAQAGAEVVVISRRPSTETVKMIEEAGGKGYYLQADVTDPEAVDAALDEVVKRSGHIDVVFNNAGICVHKPALAESHEEWRANYVGEGKPFPVWPETTIEEWRRVVDVNLTGEYIVACAAARRMIRLGIKGSIINMASMSGTIANIPQWQASYNASKAAVIHMTRSLALEWAEFGIRVNSLSPGYIGTPMSSDTEPELREAWDKLYPMHRMGKPEELIPAVLYMASDAAGYTNGADTIVDGAYTSF